MYLFGQSLCFCLVYIDIIYELIFNFNCLDPTVRKEWVLKPEIAQEENSLTNPGMSQIIILCIHLKINGDVVHPHSVFNAPV